MAIVRYLEDRR